MSITSEIMVSPSAPGVIEWLPTMGMLEAEPTGEVLSKDINSLASGKAPGSDGIPPGLFKHCKITLQRLLHEVLCQCWQEGIYHMS